MEEIKLYDLKYYSKDYLNPEKLKLSKYERIELLIFLIKYLNINSEIKDYYMILGGRSIISRHSFDEGDYLIQNTRILLKTINQVKVYRDELKKYEDEEENKEKLYIRVDNSFLEKEGISNKVKLKKELYLKLLSLKLKYDLPKNRYAFQDEKIYGIKINDEKIELETLSEIIPMKLSKINKKSKGATKIKFEDLVSEAKKIDNVLSKDKPYREVVIKNSKFKILKGSTYVNTKSIEIDNITNIVGQVAAGKSTFSDALVLNLSKRKKKMLIIEPSVRKVLKRSKDFDKLNIKVVPLVGRTSWSEHIERANDGKDFLEDYDSQILTSGCILGGLIKDSDITIKYGEEPCKEVYKFYEQGLNKSQLNLNVKYDCPYYYSCPRTKINRDIIDAEVIVTTTASLINSSIGISEMTLFQYTLENIDLVIVDEAESELKKADEMFAPLVSYDSYIKDTSRVGYDYYKKDLNIRANNEEKDVRNFTRLHTESNEALVKIQNMLKSNKQGIAKSYIITPFTGSKLINICKENELLPKELIKDLDKMVGITTSKKYERIIRDTLDIDKKSELEESFRDYSWGVEDLKEEQVNVVIFIIAVLYFESLYRKISNLVEGNSSLPISTKRILSQWFEVQQRYIPVSPKGNIFALKYKESDDGKYQDLYIIKQFAMGRSMYLRFPWLKLDRKGNPLGPKVLLLSGSSFAPYSFSNHISEPVEYIIEAEEYKREFISKSKFEYIDTGIRVSGSGEFRDNNLRQLVRECKELILDELEEDEKNILMIVNSYSDAEIVKTQLKNILTETDYKEKVSYLVSDHDTEDEEKVKQSKVSGFYNRKSRILVAPAILIERGHNIVDDKGNSAFDVLMFLTRPMGNPNDYISHVPKVNGYIMSMYSESDLSVDNEVFIQMRKNANALYYKLESYKSYGLKNLSEDIQEDIVVSLFVMILQIFGRLCRVGNKEYLKSNAPKVYFLDSAFKGKDENSFDFLNRLVDYLDFLMNSDSTSGEVARTLYEPFYKALKKGRNIYGKR